MIEYPVIVEQKNGIWRAFIPALADLSAEGMSCDEAVQKAQQAAEAYLSSVVVTTIRVNTAPPQSFSRRSPQNWIRSAGKFAGDEETMR